jgi:hypothetical protein
LRLHLQQLIILLSQVVAVAETTLLVRVVLAVCVAQLQQRVAAEV